MSIFQAEYQNKSTNWEWIDAFYTPQTDEGGTLRNGVYMNDIFIVPDYSITYKFYTWSNFRIKNTLGLERINLFAAKHLNPDLQDINGVKMQNGEILSTHSPYENFNNIYKNSDRIYFWIDSTNQDEDYGGLGNQIFNSKMAAKAVSSAETISIPRSSQNIKTQYTSWLGWNPSSNPLGTGISSAWVVTPSSSPDDVARWIMGWDNTCVNIRGNLINVFGLSGPHRAIVDAYQMIDGVSKNDLWLGCKKDKYIYGKILYSLEDHDFINNRLLSTTGTKSFGIEGVGLYYGG